MGLPLPPAKRPGTTRADHGFHVPKRSGRTDDEVLEEPGEVVGSWIEGSLKG